MSLFAVSLDTVFLRLFILAVVSCSGDLILLPVLSLQ